MEKIKFLISRSGDLDNVYIDPFVRGEYRIYMTTETNIPLNRVVFSEEFEPNEILPLFQREGGLDVDEIDEMITLQPDDWLVERIGQIVNTGTWVGRVLIISIPESIIEDPVNFLTEDNYPDGRTGYRNPLTGRRIRAPRTLDRVLDNYNLREIDILGLPYNEVDMNKPGKYDSNCVINYIISAYSMSGTKSYRISEKSVKKFFKNTNCRSLVNFCKKYKITVRLYDVFGNLITKNISNGKRKALNAMIANNHLYVITKPIRKDNDSHIDLSGTNSSDKAYSSIVDKMESDMELGLDIYKKLSKYSLSWVFNSEIENTFFSQAVMKNDVSPGEYYEYDVKKCYATIIKNFCSRIPVFTVFDYLRPFSGELDENYMYVIKYPVLERLAKKYGLIMNLFIGKIIKFLISKNEITTSDITHYRPCSRFISGKQFLKDIKTDLSWDDWDTNRKLPDALRIMVGMCGKTHKTPFRKTFSGVCGADVDIFDYQTFTNQKYSYMNFDGEVYSPPSGEVDSNYSYKEGSCTVTCRSGKERKLNINMHNISMYVKQMANLLLIEALESTGLEADYIMTDSFWLRSKVDNFKHSSMFRINKVVATPDHLDRKNDRVIYHDIEKIVSQEQEEIKNIGDKFTFIYGPPGSGKTYKAMRMSPDIGIATTNLACLNMKSPSRDIPIMTCYKFFSMKDSSFNPACYNGKTIWIDEVSMISRVMWSYIYYMAYNSTCKFILTGDFNQAPPVKEEKYSYSSVIFKHMNFIDLSSFNHRNCPRLVSIRDASRSVIMDNISKDNSFNCDTHICYTNKRCHLVNKHILEKRELTKESVGVILKLNKTIKKYGVAKGERLLRIDSDKYKRFLDGSVVEIKNLSKHCTIGFALTVHSVQGQTLGDTVIHEMEKMPSWLVYTAVTRVKKIDSLSYCDFELDGEYFCVYTSSDRFPIL